MDQEADNLPFTASLGLSAYRSWHDRNKYEGLNLETEGLSLTLSRSTRFLGGPLYLSLDGGASQTGLDGEDFSQVSTLGAGAYWWPSSSVMFGLKGQQAWNEFEGTSEYPEYFDRDGEDWSAGSSLDLYFAEGRVVLGLTYSYRDSDSEGSQFRFDSHNGGAQLHIQFPMKVRLSGGAEYQQSDYTDFLPTPTRIDDVWTYSAALVRPFLDQKLNLELGYTHIDADSSTEFATYTQNITTLALSLNL
jgi:hypothetical protein